MLNLISSFARCCDILLVYIVVYISDQASYYVTALSIADIP